ncbi:complex I subunit 5 family protein [Streptomyces sp. NPDC092296]|uniref:complex I subunit 5 family protein n=1 Tax=Streptomyces sp. NPDC092296 TaxID=3366012 RepID=UPI0037F6881A
MSGAGPATADLLPLAVALPLLGATLSALAGRWLPRTATDTLATVCATATVADLAALLLRSGDRRTVEWLGGWRPVHGHGVGIVLVGDGIGIGLALLAATLVLAVLCYSWRYFDEPASGHPGTFPALLLLFEAGMCGFALTGDLFNAFVFFELMSVVGYALTGFHVEDPRPLQGALTFGAVTSLAAYTSLLGIGLVYARTGELGFAQLGRALDDHPRRDALLAVALGLVLVALLVKAAVVPFHFWLPDAHAVAPTPVCMLLSGVMVELGLYGVARVYSVAFAGPGGVPQDTVRPLLLAAGVLTALVGAAMCWQQRHLKRLLAFSTVAHTGLFLAGAALFAPGAAAGTALYVLGHAGVKAALFGWTGVLLDRHGSVDEHGLHGRARDMPVTGALFALAALALAGLPPFGLGLGKAVAEHAAGEYQPWLPVVYLLVSAVTGGAVLRVALRIFAGAGPQPVERPTDRPETTGGGEEPEITDPSRRIPRPMLAVPAVLLAGALALGLAPTGGVARAAAGFTDRAGYLAAVLGGPAHPAPAAPPTGWTGSGAALGLLSAAVACALAGCAVQGRRIFPRAARRARALAAGWSPLRRLHSGHLGDYLAWLTAGTAVLLVALSTGLR